MDDNQRKAYDQFCNVNYRSFSDWLSSQSGYEIAIVGNVLGMLIAKNLNFSQQHSLGNFLILLGHTIVSIGLQQKLSIETKAKYAPPSESDLLYLHGDPPLYPPMPNGDIEYLKEQIYLLSNEINQLKRK